MDKPKCRTKQRVEIYEAALNRIRALGQVCEGFETCTHAACAASHAAYEEAARALEDAAKV